MFVEKVKIFSVIFLKIKSIFKNSFYGIAIGVVNGLFGAGGGMLAVPVLKKIGLTQTEAHANAIAVIVPVTLVSASMYLVFRNVEIKDAIGYIPTGVIGALLGTFCLKKISPLWLKRIFGVFMVYAGVRLLLR